MNQGTSAASVRTDDAPRVDVVDALLRLRSSAPEAGGSEWSGAPPRVVEPRESVIAPGEVDRNLAAVSRSLGWAQESADRGDYLDALGWIEVVEAIGAELSTSFQIKRQAWIHALGAGGSSGDGQRA